MDDSAPGRRIRSARSRAAAALPPRRSAGILPLVGRTDAAYTSSTLPISSASSTAAVDSPANATFCSPGIRSVTTRDLSKACARRRTARGRIVRVPLAITSWRLSAATRRDPLRQAALINSRRYAELASEGFVCRVDRLRDRLGIVARIGLTEGLADAYAWYRSEGWL